MIYGPEMTLREARALYFEINNFKDGGYGEAWVKMKAGPFPIWFPNTKARVRAVKYHDLHHVLTEYPTTWRGEAEIGAWEIATGCANHYPALLLDLEALAIGLVICPRGVFRAFVRGRRSRNLYRQRFDDELLAAKVGDMREELRLSETHAEASSADRLSFAAWSFAGVVVFAGVIGAVLLPLALMLAAALWWLGFL
ncbi:MAG TPA: hypothetical protein VEX60_10885 [Pyrinomonadaceae bacterium]|nr:hypothetical protein [Pyrinomonadaceae bacterium]